MSQDNVVKFRKRTPPPAPKKPPPKKPVRPGSRVPPYVILILAALAIGGVTYLLDQGRTVTPPASAPPGASR